MGKRIKTNWYGSVKADEFWSLMQVSLQAICSMFKLWVLVGFFFFRRTVTSSLDFWMVHVFKLTIGKTLKFFLKFLTLSRPILFRNLFKKLRFFQFLQNKHSKIFRQAPNILKLDEIRKLTVGHRHCFIVSASTLYFYLGRIAKSRYMLSWFKQNIKKKIRKTYVGLTEFDWCIAKQKKRNFKN